MSPKVQEYIESIRDDHWECDSVDTLSINSLNLDGENALHVAIHRGDTDMAKLLIAEGIDIHQPGDLGNTPLHDACSTGNMEIVRVLVESGADLFALNEGNPPFTLARFGKHDMICDYLAVEMQRRQAEDPKVWTRARISQLQREINRLERLLSEGEK
jgi:ankyrin repeat protein